MLFDNWRHFPKKFVINITQTYELAIKWWFDGDRRPFNPHPEKWFLVPCKMILRLSPKIFLGCQLRFFWFTSMKPNCFQVATLKKRQHPIKISGDVTPSMSLLRVQIKQANVCQWQDIFISLYLPSLSCTEVTNGLESGFHRPFLHTEIVCKKKAS